MNQQHAVLAKEEYSCRPERTERAHVQTEEPQLFFTRFRPRRRDARPESRLSFDAVLGRHFWPASPKGR
jgi:hypothetical protein